MKIIHQCMTTVGWQPVRVSSSTGEAAYTVHVNPWGLTHENICECKGYMYAGKCRHQASAAAKLCGWHELIGPETQIPQYRRDARCPRCEGPTHRTVTEDEV